MEKKTKIIIGASVVVIAIAGTLLYINNKAEKERRGSGFGKKQSISDVKAKPIQKAGVKDRKESACDRINAMSEQQLAQLAGMPYLHGLPRGTYKVAYMNKLGIKNC